MQDPVTLLLLQARLRAEQGRLREDLVSIGAWDASARKLTALYTEEALQVMRQTGVDSYIPAARRLKNLRQDMMARALAQKPSINSISVNEGAIRSFQSPNAVVASEDITRRLSVDVAPDVVERPAVDEPTVQFEQPQAEIVERDKVSVDKTDLLTARFSDQANSLLTTPVTEFVADSRIDAKRLTLMGGDTTAATIPEVEIAAGSEAEVAPVASITDITALRQTQAPYTGPDLAPNARLTTRLEDVGSAALQPLTPSSSDQPTKQQDSGNLGAILSVLGAAQQVIGNFYSIKSQKSQLKQQALSLEFQQRMSQINARAAERQASDILQAGRQQAMETTLRYGQIREGARATMGARGVRANVGSGAEVLASINLTKEIDKFTIDANAVRAANAARMQGVNAMNEGLLAGTSASSLRAQAGALSPAAGAFPSLLTGAGQFLSQRAADRRWAAYAASQGLGGY